MINKITRLAAAVLSAALLLTGCGRTDGSVSGKTTENNGHEGLHVVTSFFPVYVATINVTHDVPGVTVTNMTEPQTGCLHDYTLKPEDLKLLEKADAFVINGAGMESFLTDVMNQQEGLKIVEAAEGIPVLTQENGEENPHVWVSLDNAVSYVNNIADQLSEIDEQNAALYKKNAADYVEKIELLNTEMHNKLDGFKGSDIITFHEAFPYFAQELGLNIAAVVEREPGTEPTAKELDSIIKIVNQTGIKALFAEPQYSSGAAGVIANETGAVLYTLDPVVTGEAVPESADAYLNAMRRNMETLMEALE